MRKSYVDLQRNISNISKLPYCKIVHRNKYSFGVEISVREGRYVLRLDYEEQDLPRVYLVSPEIEVDNWEEIHTFNKQYHRDYKKKLPMLCLTHYQTDKWSTSTPLVGSYIPWAIEWTEFYELWLLTGKWYGKGIHTREKGE